MPKQRVNSDVADAGSARSPYTENTFCSCYNLLFFSFMCKGVLSSCMFEHHVCTQCLWRLEEGVRSLSARVTGDCEPVLVDAGY